MPKVEHDGRTELEYEDGQVTVRFFRKSTVTTWSITAPYLGISHRTDALPEEEDKRVVEKGAGKQ